MDNQQSRSEKKHAEEFLLSFFEDQNYRDAAEKILQGKIVKDSLYRNAVARRLIEISLNNDELNSEYAYSAYELDQVVLGLVGFNENGKPVIDDLTYIENNLNPLLKNMMDRDLNNDYALRIINGYLNSDSKLGLDENLKRIIDKALDADIVRKVYYYAKNNDLPINYDKPEVLKNKSETLEGKRDQSSEQKINIDNVVNEDLSISEDDDYFRHKYDLNQEQRVLAEMRFNQLMESDPLIVKRNIFDKIKRKAKNTIGKMAGDSLVYPKESLLGESIAYKDSNDRVVNTLLHFKGFSGLNKRVEFSEPNVDTKFYDIAVAKIQMEGITKPHINSTFSDPDRAIKFMQNSVDALVRAGYDLDDVSVSSELKAAFENYKLEHYGVNYSIGEKPPEEKETNKKERELMPEEQFERDFLALNDPLTKIGETLQGENTQGLNRDFKDLNVNELRDCLMRLDFMHEPYDPKKITLTEPNRKLVQGAFDYLYKVIEAGNNYTMGRSKRPLGLRQSEKIKALGQDLLNKHFENGLVSGCMNCVDNVLLNNNSNKNNNTVPKEPNTNMINDIPAGMDDNMPPPNMGDDIPAGMDDNMPPPNMGDDMPVGMDDNMSPPNMGDDMPAGMDDNMPPPNMGDDMPVGMDDNMPPPNMGDDIPVGMDDNMPPPNMSDDMLQTNIDSKLSVDTADGETFLDINKDEVKVLDIVNKSFLELSKEEVEFLFNNRDNPKFEDKIKIYDDLFKSDVDNFDPSSRKVLELVPDEILKEQSPDNYVKLKEKNNEPAVDVKQKSSSTSLKIKR